jgi:hypothetical protein
VVYGTTIMTKPQYTPEPRKQWIRKDYDLDYLHGKSPRERAEIETSRDLSKPIEQLVCDFHDVAEIALAKTQPDEVNANSLLIHAEKRMVALMGRVALAHERTSRWLVWLTVVLVLLTAVLVWLTVVLATRPT